MTARRGLAAYWRHPAGKGRERERERERSAGMLRRSLPPSPLGPLLAAAGPEADARRRIGSAAAFFPAQDKAAGHSRLLQG